jgi:hypothetical protein
MDSSLLALRLDIIEIAVVLDQPCDMKAVRDDGRTVVRSLQELRIHLALEETGFCAFLPELQEIARCQEPVMPEQPVLVTHSGVILAGFVRWRMAVSRRVPTIECLEYTLSDEEALQFMLSLQKRRDHWNPFIRIRLALKLEGGLQQRALTNMQMGRLEFNAHVHVMVTAGGLETSGGWMPSVYYYVDALTCYWRRGVIRLLRASLRAGCLATELPAQAVEEILIQQENRWWSVKLQSLGSREHFLRYAGRYAMRPSIVQRRMIGISKQEIKFWAKDRRLRRRVIMRLTPKEFLAAWMQHLQSVTNTRFAHSDYCSSGNWQ